MDLVQRNIGKNELSQVSNLLLPHMTPPASSKLTWNVASTPRIPILVPDSSHCVVFLENLKVDVSQSLRNANAHIDTSIASSNDSDFEGSEILDRLVFECESRTA